MKRRRGNIIKTIMIFNYITLSVILAANMALGFSFSEDFKTTANLDTMVITAFWNSKQSEVCLPPAEAGVWQTSLTTTGYASPRAVAAANASVVWAVGNAVIHKSVDGGQNWIQQEDFGASIPYFHGAFECITAVDEMNVWASGEFPDVIYYYTQDGGSNWHKNDLSSISFWTPGISAVDALNLWLIDGSGKVFYTSDGGINWDTKNIEVVSTFFQDISAASYTTAWVVGLNGVIVFTDDGGDNWVSQDSQVTANLYGVFAVNETTAWVAGTAGTILFTNDGGSTWTKQNSGTGTNLFEVSAVGSNQAWVVGDNNTVLYTNNQGTTWNPQTVQNDGSVCHFYSLTTPDPITAFATGAGTAVFKYQDNYRSQAVVQSLKINPATITSNISKGVITTNEILNGQIVKYFLSADGGIHWESVTAGNEHGFLYPGKDLRWKAELSSLDGGKTTPVLKEIRVDYFAEELARVSPTITVFPNPYHKVKSGAGGITFKPLPHEAVIKIFNPAGELIKTIDHKATAGDGSAVWNIAGIASGIYIYFVKSPQATVTGKISILK